MKFFFSKRCSIFATCAKYEGYLFLYYVDFIWEWKNNCTHLAAWCGCFWVVALQETVARSKISVRSLCMKKLRCTGNLLCRSNTDQFWLGRSIIERNCKVEAQLSGIRWSILARQQTYGANRWTVNRGSRHISSIDFLAASLSRCRKRMHFSSSLSRGSGGMHCQEAGLVSLENFQISGRFVDSFSVHGQKTSH
jgi:hypothetical protein